ncbi:SRPBCC domain-containing protein [Streptomyces sp. KR80]|uniref:SRPBCC domain-containing protein n=1 Tax=Streptomyces sp. KR80 TaxID=3457426 RepID=UPI003FD11F29
MEHEVFVPFPTGTVRQALADPVRVARCIPGFLGDGDASDALSGRMRVRIGNSTITYRGRLRITEQEDGDLAVEGEGTEARGSGSVKLALHVRLSAASDGSLLACTGTVRSEGRLADAGETAATTAGRRLLDRFATELAAGLESSPIGTDDAAQTWEPDAPVGDRPLIGSEDDNQRAIPGIPAPDKPKNGSPSGAASPPDTAGAAGASGAADTEDATGAAEAAEESDARDGVDAGPEQPQLPPDQEPEPGTGPEPEPASVFETEVPPPSLDPLSDEEDAGREPPAEAAHARRTMIGRSAEEVDHAPPRGRYAPVPAPEAGFPTDTLRWAAPVAAVLIASAVVVGRMLRRRR